MAAIATRVVLVASRDSSTHDFEYQTELCLWIIRQSACRAVQVQTPRPVILFSTQMNLLLYAFIICTSILSSYYAREDLSWGIALTLTKINIRVPMRHTIHGLTCTFVREPSLEAEMYESFTQQPYTQEYIANFTDMSLRETIHWFIRRCI